MATFPVNQKIKNAKNQGATTAPQKKSPRTKVSDPTFSTSSGDLGILRVQNPNIPRQVKAPTRTSDGTSHAMANVMKKAGILV